MSDSGRDFCLFAAYSTADLRRFQRQIAERLQERGEAATPHQEARVKLDSYIADELSQGGKIDVRVMAARRLLRAAADAGLQDAIAALIGTCLAKSSEAMELAERCDEENDGANSHAFRKEARVRREMADELAALRDASFPLSRISDSEKKDDDSTRQRATRSQRSP